MSLLVLLVALLVEATATRPIRIVAYLPESAHRQAFLLAVVAFSLPLLLVVGGILVFRRRGPGRGTAGIPTRGEARPAAREACSRVEP